MRTCCDGLTVDMLRHIVAAIIPPDVDLHTHGKRKIWGIGGGLDCETTATEDGYSYVYIWQMALGETVLYGRYAESLTPLLQALDKTLKTLHDKRCHRKPKQYPQLIIYDCNLGYEWAHLKRQIAAAGVRSVFAKTPRRPLVVSVGMCIEIREALGVWGYSLANIADTYCQHKKMLGDLDYSLSRHSKTHITDAEWGYIENDVLILAELVPIANKRFAGQSLPLTGTGIIREACKTELKKRTILKFERAKIAKLMPKTQEEYNTMATLLFCGGLSHSKMSAVYDTSRVPYEHVVCADLVSDYPAQMLHHTFPAGQMLSNLMPGEMAQYEHWWCMITFRNIRSKAGHSLFSRHKLLESDPDTIYDNGRVYASSSITVYCTEVDYRNAQKIYDFDQWIECYDCHAFTASEPIPVHLRDVLCRAYRRKNELKKQGLNKTQEYVEAKKLVNGCFGMCGTRIYISDCEWDDEKQDIAETPTDKDYAGLIKNVWLSPWIAVYTSAYAREVLCTFIAAHPECIVQYDTDSIYYRTDLDDSAALDADIDHYNNAIRQRNAAIFAGDEFFSDLGTWERDPPIDRFKCLGAKRYLKETAGKIKIVCAGCKPAAFAEYIDRTGEDPFDVFTPGMLMHSDDSKKTTLRYYDTPVETTITDYLGEKENVRIETCGRIVEIPFSMTVSEEWLRIADYIMSQPKFLR